MTHQFIAYEASPPSSHPPSNVQATSNVVTVTWVANWAGSVTLSSSASQAATGTPVTLTATASQVIKGSGLDIEIFDHTTGTLLGSCTSGSTCSASNEQTANTTHTYIAYVAGPSSSDPPPSIAATSTPVAVTCVGVPSSACSAAQPVVFDGWVAGEHVMLRALTSGSQTIVCYSAFTAATGEVGGNTTRW